MSIHFDDRTDLDSVTRCALHLISAGCEIIDGDGMFAGYGAFERVMWADDETMHRYGIGREDYGEALRKAWAAIEHARAHGCDARFYTPP